MRLLVVCSALLMLLPASFAHAQRTPIEYADAVPTSVAKKTVIIERKLGTGAEATSEAFVVFHYDGWVFDPNATDFKGKKFDSSRDRGPPLSVLFGVGRMITGLDKGLEGMKVGGQRTLVIPPTMGYGARKAFNELPPNSILIFDVELLDVVPERNIN